jgi:hypothetical protein
MSVLSRHPAYGPCLSIDYDLDVVGIPGNGWTRDGIG